MKAAALRGSDAFRPGLSPVMRLAVLERELAGTHADYKHQALGEWVVRHLTPEGRTRVLATLRRRRADAKPGTKKAVPMRRPARTADDLKALAKQTGMPGALVLETLLSIASSDAELRRQMVKLGVAFGLRSRSAAT